MQYNFKIGDKVITSNGRRGTITKICDCDRCKARGFFEPRVSFDDNFPVWITDTDFHLGFTDFYSIGEYYFGNIDDTEPLEQRIEELQDEIAEIRGSIIAIKKLMQDKRRMEKQDDQRTDY